MKSLSLIVFICILFNVPALSLGFEGVLTYSYKTKYDTLYYKITVKQKQIRVDIIHKGNDMRHSYIANYDERDYKVLDCHMKKYFIKERIKNPIINDLQAMKTKNSKDLEGMQCFQWRVKSVKNNTEIAYWVVQGNYMFISEVMESLPFEDNVFRYFSAFRSKESALPILIVERTLLRVERVRVSLENIKPCSIRDDVFEVPKNHKLLKKHFL